MLEQPGGGGVRLEGRGDVDDGKRRAPRCWSSREAEEESLRLAVERTEDIERLLGRKGRGAVSTTSSVAGAEISRMGPFLRSW
mmetsp:Transcript_50335/g.102486  ORF Transcript_50335/g.102486 Transcript_50335/m.102486 type:complete len:83 (+) Transcript_50335:668-916(+)